MLENTSEPSVVVRGPLAGARAVRAKVKQDIDFLRDRITALEQQARLNIPVIQTYRRMLESRLSVLRWLELGDYDAAGECTGTG